jgi:hypothetical protein
VARTTVALAAAQIERQSLLVTAGSVWFPLRPQAVGLAVDEAATTRAVQRAARAGNLLTQLLGPLLRRLDPIEVG